MARKNYGRKSADGKRKRKRTPERKLLEYMLGLKEEVLEREVMPWDSGRLTHLPYNPFTGRRYGGLFNLLMLQVRAFGAGWTDPRFITRGKAKEIRADFRGQRMTQLWYPVQRKEVDEDTGEEEVVGVAYRPFFVFNAQQFANLAELDIPPLQVSTWGDTDVAGRIDAVKRHILTNFKHPPVMREEAMIRAPHYLPATHEVVLPPAREYRKPERFAQSMIHELAHATGAPGELGRFKVGEYGKPCAPQGGEYACEEMATQFATASLLMQYGFAHERKTSADYILSWYESVEDKPELLGLAVKEAMAVMRYINEDNPLPNAAIEDGAEETPPYAA